MLPNTAIPRISLEALVREEDDEEEEEEEKEEDDDNDEEGIILLPLYWDELKEQSLPEKACIGRRTLRGVIIPAVN